MSNTSQFGLNGLNSEITALNVGSAIGMVLSPGGEWDLGNVAVTGMTAADILARFTTDPDATPGGVAQPGTFLVSYFNGGVASLTTPSAITVVPEPSTYAMMLAGATVGGLTAAVALWLAIAGRASTGVSTTSPHRARGVSGRSDASSCCSTVRLMASHWSGAPTSASAARASSPHPRTTPAPARACATPRAAPTTVWSLRWPS